MRHPTPGLLAILALLPAATARPEAAIDPWVLAHAPAEPREVLVLLREQADLRGAGAPGAPREEAARAVVERLRHTAEASQGSVLELLRAVGSPHQPFWIVNMILVRADEPLVRLLASHPDVRAVLANPRVPLGALPPAPAETADAPRGVEWNIAKVGAPAAWAAGYRGQGVVVAGQDTGYQWDHPALRSQYRGWSGTAAVHDYSWHDAIHSGGGVCGPDSPEPCDDYGHGTHTMGTIVGDDGGGNQIGMAPGARWIACRNMDQGVGTPATYAECFQWFMAPTDLSGQNPDPSKAPHVINNSWGCPPSEGCTNPDALKGVVEATRAAGIVVVVSAGNSGPSCGSVSDPPAIYDASFSVGATDAGDAIGDFSSRGSVTVDGSNRIKPDVSAPGVDIRSAVPGSGYQGGWSGTSMAGPHVAGLVALHLSASPGLAGQVDAIETLVASTALPLTSAQSCGGVGGTQIPNNTFGHGRIQTVLSPAPGESIVAGAGHGPGNANRIRVFTAGGTATSVDVLAYGAGSWGAQGETGALRGASLDDIVTGPGPGPTLGPQVKAYDRAGAPIAAVNFFAYGTLRFGVVAEAPGLDGDAFAEMATGAGAGAVFGPHVRGFGFDNAAVAPLPGLSFYAYATLRHGVHVGHGSFAAGGADELLTAPGPGPTFGAQVRGWRYAATAVAPLPGLSFAAFPSPGFGAFVAGGDVDGAGLDEIAATHGPGPALAARVRGFAYTGSAVTALPGFDAVPFTTLHGARATLADVTGDGDADAVLAPGPDPAASARVRAYRYDGAAVVALPVDVDAFPGLAHGANVGAGALGY